MVCQVLANYLVPKLIAVLSSTVFLCDNGRRILVRYLFCRGSVLPLECPQAMGVIIPRHRHSQHQSHVQSVANYLQIAPTSDVTCVSILVKSRTPVPTARTEPIKRATCGCTCTIATLTGMPRPKVPDSFCICCLLPGRKNENKYLHSLVCVEGRLFVLILKGCLQG